MKGKQGPEGDYYAGSEREGWLKAILIFVGGILLVSLCSAVLWGNYR